MRNREIDTAIAERVMGWNTRQRWELSKKIHEYAFQNINHPDKFIWIEIPHYSTNIQDAWLVLEKVCVVHEWRAIIDRNQDQTEVNFKTQMGGWAQPYGIAETTPMAICLAVLETVEVTV